MMNSNWHTEWPAPAKLNLFLHIVGRRADGYHLLQTVFRFIDYGDSLCFTPRSDEEIVLATPMPGVDDATNLVVRAAQALQSASGLRQGVTIHLTKRLPLGGGLGGGSSDAATTLIALNQLWQTGLSNEQLQTLGLTLGADVPIFIYGRAAFAEGVGEKFTPVSVPPAWYLVVAPPVNVPTAQIFASATLRRDVAPIEPKSWRDGFGSNVMQPVACTLFPPVAQCLMALQAYGHARMSGSGACCFVAFQSEAEATAALVALRQQSPTLAGFVAKGLERHPLWGLGTGKGADEAPDLDPV